MRRVFLLSPSASVGPDAGAKSGLFIRPPSPALPGSHNHDRTTFVEQAFRAERVGGSKFVVTLRLGCLRCVVSMEDYAMGETHGNQRNDPVLLRALATRDKLRRELQDVDTFLKLYSRFGDGSNDAAFQQQQNQDTDKSSTKENATDNLAEQGTHLNPGMRQVELIPFVRKLLLENGRPLLPLELATAIKTRGRSIGGTDEVNNLKSKLWRAKQEIVMISGAGYWPIDVSCEAVSYEPPTINTNDQGDADPAVSASG